MKLPLIKHINKFIAENDIDYIHETLEVLEHLSESSSLKDAEIDVLGELISNLYGSLEVHKLMKNEGKNEKDALNSFMSKVLGSIDK